jgi:hypothetical protein
MPDAKKNIRTDGARWPERMGQQPIKNSQHKSLLRSEMWPCQKCVFFCRQVCIFFFELAPGGISKLLVESLTNFIITTITTTTTTTTTDHQLTTIISTLLPHQVHFFNNLLLPYPIYYHCLLLDLLQFSVKVVIEELTT